MGLRAHHNLLGPSAAEDAATMRARAAAAAEDRAMQQRLAAAEAAGFQGEPSRNLYVGHCAFTWSAEMGAAASEAPAPMVGC